jgi:hypothetical protein
MARSICAAPEGRAVDDFVSIIGGKKRPANSLKMPSKFAELVLPDETMEMQTDLLCGRQEMVLRCEYFLGIVIDVCPILSIHKTETITSNNSGVRIVPYRDMGFCPRWFSRLIRCLKASAYAASAIF